MEKQINRLKLELKVLELDLLTLGKEKDMAIKSTSELRELLLETIEQVKHNKIGTKEATAIATLSSRVMQAANHDFQATKFSKMYKGTLKTSTPLVK